MNEATVRELCARFLRGQGEVDDERLLASDEELAREVAGRLDACGVLLLRRAEQPPLCVIPDTSELPELALACLALCALALQAPGRPRLSVHEIWERVGAREGYTEPYVRRAGLGPLEARGLINVTKPGQRAQQAYVTAGPALPAIDPELLRVQAKSLASGNA
jgi:hypothetical protein